MDTFILIGIIALGLGIPAGVILYLRLKAKGKVATGWTLDPYSSNVKLEVKGNLFEFDFPVGYPGVHSITRYVSGLKVGGKVFITYEILGKDAVFEAAGLTPELRLFLGDGRMYSLGPSNARPLQLGIHTLVVALTPENWKTVDGIPFNHDDAHKRLFEKCLPDSWHVGPIFGDEHGNAHGAYLKSGSARFKLVSFSA